MTYYDREDQFLRQRLQKEIPVLTALIKNLYEGLDRRFHLNGAKVPVTFGFDTDSLGSYTRQSAHNEEHFHFSLFFIAYGVKIHCLKKIVSIYLSMNMHIICGTICQYLKNINGRQERTGVRGSIAALL